MRRTALFLSVGAVVMLLASGAMAKQPKVDVCHIPPGNPDNAHTINISEKAVAAHQDNHGDIACSCDVIDDCEALGGVLDEASCICATGFGDCFTYPPPDSPACLPDEACLLDDFPPDNTLGVCTLQDCTDAGDCPDAPAGGTAPVVCIDVNGDGVNDCLLLCDAGQACPIGMVCIVPGICVWQ